MESTQAELKQLAATATNAADNAAKELLDLQLVVAAGGLGEVSLI